MKQATIIIFALTLFIAIPSANAERSVTFQTYYPSPGGGYNNLTMTPHHTNDDLCSTQSMLDGTFYFNSLKREIRICGTPEGTFSGGQWELNGNDLYPIATTASDGLKIGIGTQNPQARLHIVESNNTGSSNDVEINASDGTDGNTGIELVNNSTVTAAGVSSYIDFRAGPNSDTDDFHGRLSYLYGPALSGPSRGAMSIRAVPSSSVHSLLVENQNGYVGVMMTPGEFPTSELHVKGNELVEGNTTVTGSVTANGLNIDNGTNSGPVDMIYNSGKFYPHAVFAP